MYAFDDPLARALAPPVDESADDRMARVRREEEAQRVNDEIEARMKEERAGWRKHKDMFKLLLLGQSESGKSTTLKNFQLAFAPNAWKADRASWRALIQLNLVRSLNSILDVLSEEFPPHSSISSPYLSQTHALLKLRLAPLRRVEDDLKKLIGAATDQVSEQPSSSAFPYHSTPDSDRRRPPEYYVRSNASWREAVRTAYHRISPNDMSGRLRDRATEIIASCAEDMDALWRDAVVRDLLRRRKIRLELSPGFFLDDIPRIAHREYEPSDDDIVRSRLRTVGVQEYKLVTESSASTSDVGREWMIYDVGGSRTSRAAWYPYFDDANAILFLAPMSCFDERLAEDRRVNRLEDSFLLWKGIVQSKLLAKCIIVLFLNKYDLLDQKLRAGVKVNKYLPSFAERENTAPVLARYLLQKFREQQREVSPDPSRAFYGYITTAINTKATASTLSSVRDGVLRHNLQRADFM